MARSNGRRPIARVGRIAAVALALPIAYFALGAAAIRWAAEDPLRIAAGRFEELPAAKRVEVGTSRGAISMRAYGRAHRGCVVVFPGRQGPVADYEHTVVPALDARGIEVFLPSYAYADGSLPPLRSLGEIAREVVKEVDRRCGPGRYVLAGRSLGTLVALYCAASGHPAGMVLDGASPSLSTAIRRELQSRWYSVPLALLPIEHLVAHDYSIAEAQSLGPLPHTMIFQGTRDRRTPLHDLTDGIPLPRSIVVVPVEGAGHSDAYRAALPLYIEAVSSMLPPEPAPDRSKDAHRESRDSHGPSLREREP